MSVTASISIEEFRTQLSTGDNKLVYKNKRDNFVRSTKSFLVKGGNDEESEAVLFYCLPPRDDDERSINEEQQTMSVDGEGNNKQGTKRGRITEQPRRVVLPHEKQDVIRRMHLHWGGGNT